MRAPVAPHHDRARLQPGTQHLFQVRQKDIAIGRGLHRHSGQQSVAGHGSQEREGVPVTGGRGFARSKRHIDVVSPARRANISGKEAVKAFEKASWRIVGQVGSHLVMAKAGTRANLSVPQHKELSVRTLRVLIRHAGITVEEFLDLL